VLTRICIGVPTSSVVRGDFATSASSPRIGRMENGTPSAVLAREAAIVGMMGLLVSMIQGSHSHASCTTAPHT
jgi:hypothetical protein